jgi:hypothetical protein
LIILKRENGTGSMALGGTASEEGEGVVVVMGELRGVLVIGGWEVPPRDRMG